MPTVNTPLKKIGDYEVHPAAALFPMLPANEMRELAEDIKEYGLIHPILLHNKLVLDGRNRLVACGIAGVQPFFRNYQGEHSPVEYILATNLKRRQLTASQRSTVAVEALPMLEAEAKERMQAGGGDQKSGKEKIPTPIEDQGQARDKAAELTKVNGAALMVAYYFETPVRQRRRNS